MVLATEICFAEFIDKLFLECTLNETTEKTINDQVLSVFSEQ